MRLPVWVHNVSSAYPGSGGLPTDDRENPFSAVYGKVNDGLRFQGTWDGHALAVGNLGDVVYHDRDIYAPQGIGYVPWGVVHGRWEGHTAYAEREGVLAGKIAMKAAGEGEAPVYIVDLEPSGHAPFPAFWRDDLGADGGDVDAFVVSFRNETKGKGRLWLAVDAREPHLAPVSFARWLEWERVVERILPMVYFTDFVRPREATTDDARDSLMAALAAIGSEGVVSRDTIFPILPGDAAPAVMEYAIEHAQEMGCGGVSVWQRGNLRLDTAQAIAEMIDPWAGEPVRPGYLRSHLQEIDEYVARISVDLGLVAAVVEQIRADLEREA